MELYFALYPSPITLFFYEGTQMSQASGRLLLSTALDGQNSFVVSFAKDCDHLFPIDDAIAAGAADWGARHLAPLRFRVFERNVLGMDVDQ